MAGCTFADIAAAMSAHDKKLLLVKVQPDPELHLDRQHRQRGGQHMQQSQQGRGWGGGRGRGRWQPGGAVPAAAAPASSPAAVLKPQVLGLYIPQRLPGLGRHPLPEGSTGYLFVGDLRRKVLLPGHSLELTSGRLQVGSSLLPGCNLRADDVTSQALRCRSVLSSRVPASNVALSPYMLVCSCTIRGRV